LRTTELQKGPTNIGWSSRSLQVQLPDRARHSEETNVAVEIDKNTEFKVKIFIGLHLP